MGLGRTNKRFSLPLAGSWQGLGRVLAGSWQSLGKAFVIAQRVLRTLARQSGREFGKRVTVPCSGKSLSKEFTLVRI